MKKKWIVISSLAIVLSAGACTKNAPAPTATVVPTSNVSPTAPSTTAPTTAPTMAPTTAPTSSPGAAVSPTAGPTTNAGAAVNAQTIFKQNCVTCHGVNLEGGVGPNLQKVGARLSADQITARIINGGGAMPPFKGTLKDTEISALAQWLAGNK